MKVIRTHYIIVDIFESPEYGIQTRLHMVNRIAKFNPVSFEIGEEIACVQQNKYITLKHAQNLINNTSVQWTGKFYNLDTGTRCFNYEIINTRVTEI